MRLEERTSHRFHAVDFDPFRDGEIENIVPVTEPQFEIWASSQMGDAASCAYNESCTVRLIGSIDLSVMQRALHELVGRHESLRASFSADGRHLLVNASIPLQVDVSDLRDTDDASIILRKITANEVSSSFDLRHGSLFRTRIVYVNKGETWVIMTAHHTVCDGWSSAILVQDLGAIYTALLQRHPLSLPRPQSFVEYAWRQQEFFLSDERVKQEAYWCREFADRAPVLELPTDKKRPAQRSYRSERLDIPVSASLLEDLRKTGAKQGASLVVTLLSAFNLWLHRITSQDDVVVGVPAAGQALEGLHRLIGHCVSLLPVRSTVDPQRSFAEYLKCMRQKILDAYDHQQVTFSKLLHQIPLERDPSRPPLVSVMFNVDQKIDSKNISFPDCDVSYFSNPRLFENFELFVNAAEVDGSMVLECQYNADLFSAQAMQRLMNAYVSLLENIVHNPHEMMGHIPMMAREERAKIVYGLNETAGNYPKESSIQELIALAAQKTPHKTAATFGDTSITYDELERRSNQLAQKLVQMGIRPGDLVGIALKRSIEMLVSLLGSLKSGAAYVPLDPTYPEKRLSHMLKSSELTMIITQSTLIKDLPANDVTVLEVDTEQAYIAELSDQAPMLEGFTAKHTAYVIFTSGSTGKPKGVKISHRAVVNLLQSMRRRPGMSADDTLLAVTTLSFDIAVLELFLPLTVGAQVVIASGDMARDGDLLLAAMQRHSITVMQATPATWRMLLEVGWKGNPQLRILCGGESLPRDLLQKLLPRVKTIWNMYGPTETTVWSTCYEISHAKQSILIGRPIDNTQIYILDAFAQPVPVGVAGEMYIGGDGVSQGYLGRDDLTVERFFENPFIPGGRIYKTGDLARYTSSGDIEYLQRNDQQVKIRGFRIELSEVQSALANHPAVQQVVVIVREDHPGDRRLVAYVKPNIGMQITSGELLVHMRRELPSYMVTHEIVILSAFPQLPNGKLDMKALPAPQGSFGGEQYVAPQTYAEKRLAEIWQEVLKADRVSITDNFFDRGGYSLLSPIVVNRVAVETGVRIPLYLFLTNTLEQIAPHTGFRQDTIASNIILDKTKSPDPSGAIAERAVTPLFFDEESSTLFGLYHKPQGLEQRSAAILLCHPGREECMRSHWAYRQLAQSLSRAGFPVLRFDYFGTGDSEGSSESGSCSRWVSDIHVAAKQLKAMSGKTGLHIVGLRLGASLAAQAVAEGLAADSLVLWDPVVNGAEYLGDLKRMQRELVEKEDNRPPYATESQLLTLSESVGFPITNMLKNELNAISLQGLDWNALPQIYFVHAEELPEYKQLQKHVKDFTHVHCEHVDDAGHWGNIDQLRQAFFPRAIIQAISAWLGGRA